MADDADLAFDEKGPERTCIVTRAKGDPRHMIRFVVGPGDAIVPDLRARLPGRGAWVTGEVARVELAVKRRAFTRAFKREVAAGAGLAAEVGALLLQETLAALSLANKAGLVMAGSFKVEGALATQKVAALLHATDGSADGTRKLDAVARRTAGADQRPPPSLQIFASHQMDLALGRANVIHAALLVGGASEAFLERAARWQRYSGAGSPERFGLEAEPETLPS